MESVRPWYIKFACQGCSEFGMRGSDRFLHFVRYDEIIEVEAFFVATTSSPELIFRFNISGEANHSVTDELISDEQETRIRTKEHLDRPFHI